MTGLGWLLSAMLGGMGLGLLFGRRRLPERGSQKRHHTAIEPQPIGSSLDPLTGLANRQDFLAQLRQAVSEYQPDQTEVVLLILDLDRFQRINNSLGQQGGDALLCSLAQRLLQKYPQPHCVGRLGSDDFAILLRSTPQDHDTGMAAALEDLSLVLQQPFEVAGETIILGASLGASSYPTRARTVDELLHQAALAMQQSKAQSWRRRTQAQPGTALAERDALHIEAALREALLKEELWLSYQPQIDLKTGRLCGCEALLRWHNPQLGEVPPSVFIPLAESCGLMAKLGPWVLHQACLDARRMRAKLGEQFVMSVNVSALQFQHMDMVAEVQQALRQTALPASALELEITENLLLENPDHARDTLKALRMMGVHVAIDDFGTGYCSLSYLLNYPVDKLKIDRSFIQHLEHNQHDADLTSAIIVLAHTLGLSVVAEGIEEDGQSRFLSDHACDLGQGYLYGRAVRADDFMKNIPPSGILLSQNGEGVSVGLGSVASQRTH
nr:bifunctional diguanylate cyclase/phosphodiesterase [Oceanococcus sp. HetDA_MAG_MS8]